VPHIPAIERLDMLLDDNGRTKPLDRYIAETKEVEALKDAYIRSLSDDIRQQLMFDDSPQIVAFLNDLCNPRQKQNVYQVARKHGITPLVLVGVMERFYKHQVVHNYFRAGPAASQRVIAEAMPPPVACQSCGGRGRLYFPPQTNDQDKVVMKEMVRDCPTCSGTGSTMQPGSIEAQKIIFKSMGVIDSKESQVQVQVNNFNGVESVLDEIERMKKKRPDHPEIELAAEATDA